MSRRNIHRLLALVLALAVTLPAAAQQQAAAKKPAAADAPQIKYEKYKLKNGLEVILSEDHRLPMVAVNLWYHVGPANERPGRTGFAHLFEHMMFQGSQHVGDDQHFKLLEAAGASDINGTTDFDRTNYFQTLPSNQLELALWLEADRMGFLLPTLNREKLANQRDVVRNERRQGVENQPYGLVEEAMFHTLYPKGHPYYASVIGSHEDLEAARLDDVRQFFREYYAPNNASLAIVGDFNPAEAKRLVEKYFGTIPAGPPVEKITATTPPITSERRVTVTDQVELPRVYMAWISDPIYKPGDAEADLLAQILGGGKASRLYKKLVYEKQIAQAVSAQQYSLILGSIFNIEATAKPGVKPEELEAAIQEELDRIRQEGPTAEELTRAKNIIESQIIRGLETLGGFGGVADRLNRYNHYLGDPGYLPKDLARYRNATAAGVKAMAADKLANNKRVVVYGIKGEKKISDPPKTAEADEAKDAQQAAAAEDKEPWRKQQPKPGAASRLTLPTPKQFKLANGLNVMVLERPNLPVVTAAVILQSGSEVNPVDKPGLAAFTADMLDEGTKTRSTLKLAQDVEEIGGNLSTNSSPDLTSVSLQTLKRNADTAFAILADVTLNPAFDQRELDRVRRQRLTSLLQQRDNPSQLATKVFYSVVYGEKHPYGFIELGTEDSLKQMTADDLRKFWQNGYAPSNAALVVAGQVTEAEARALAEKYFGQWSGKGTAAKLPDTSAAGQRRIVIVDKPGAPQTALRVGQVGVPRSHPDYVPIDVMNTNLGGLFSSKINMNLREKNGYTYGAFSRFVFRRGPGPFLVGTSVRTDVTAPAVKEIFNEIEAIRRDPLTAEELAAAKDSIIRSLPGQFETTPQSVSTIATLFIYNLPLDYYSTLPAKIEAVNPAEARRVAEKYLTPQNMIVVAVGDKAKIQPELEKLNLGPVEVRDLEGKPVTAAPAAAAKP